MYVRGAAKRTCPLAAGSAVTPSKQFCQTCEAFVSKYKEVLCSYDVYDSL